jgi:hypothetical protein
MLSICCSTSMRTATTLSREHGRSYNTATGNGRQSRLRIREIYRVVNHTCQRIVRDEGRHDRDYYVFLSPGTPQMQTIWVLLVQSGLLPARMIGSTPQDLVAPGYPIWHEVTLSLENFPQVVSPGEVSRQVGILQAQNSNLRTENRRLAAELDTLRTGGPAIGAGPIEEGFRIRDYLEAQERALLVRALDQAGNNAAAAARLLGMEPHTFRDRAARLGVWERRRLRNEKT